jgi:hypothetical protein
MVRGDMQDFASCAREFRMRTGFATAQLLLVIGFSAAAQPPGGETEGVGSATERILTSSKPHDHGVLSALLEHLLAKEKCEPLQGRAHRLAQRGQRARPNSDKRTHLPQRITERCSLKRHGWREAGRPTSAGANQIRSSRIALGTENAAPQLGHETEVWVGRTVTKQA